MESSNAQYAHLNITEDLGQILVQQPFKQSMICQILPRYILGEEFEMCAVQLEYKQASLHPLGP